MNPENELSHKDLLALVQVAGELTTQIDLAHLLNFILKKAGELTDSPDGSVLLYSPARNSLYFAAATGQKGPFLLESFGEFARQQVPIAESRAGKVFRTGESIIVDTVADDADHFKGVDAETNKATQSMLCVPLSVEGKCLGVVQLLNKTSGNYTQHDMVLLERFAQYAAIAIRNARLFEELLAHMGLYSSRQFNGGISEMLTQLNSPARSEKLTILFADMRGFRVLCQVINDPERIMRLSSQFITMLSELVLQYGGIVNKVLGDGVMAIFRNSNHAQRAVNCAFAMVSEFAGLKESWDNESSTQLDFLDIGIGITTDNTIIGTVGNAKIKDFTAMGNAVNLAAAFEKEARGGHRILVDHFTYLEVKDMVSVIEGPFNYELRQPDQRSGNFYKQYRLKQLAAAQQHKVFISYNQGDRRYVEDTLIPYLNQHQIGHWYSNDSIKAGESWVSSINEGLGVCNWILVLVSQSSRNSAWVKEEVEMAAARNHLRNRIVPLQLDDTSLESVHPFLQHKQAIDASSQPNYLDQLLVMLG